MKIPYTLSGKCGAVVYQRARHGQICYPAFVPLNPRTPDQVNGRNLFRAVNAGWARLTKPQQFRWIAVAATKLSKRRLTQGPLTGQLLYNKINYPLAYLGRPQVDLPPPCPRFPKLAVSSLLVTNVAGDLQISLACPGDPGVHTILRASAPLSAGRNTCTNFRIIGLCPPPEQGITEITALYTAIFGVPRVGAKLFLRVNQIIDGWQDHPVEFTFVVPAPRPDPSVRHQSGAGVSPALPSASPLPPRPADLCLLPPVFCLPLSSVLDTELPRYAYRSPAAPQAWQYRGGMDVVWKHSGIKGGFPRSPSPVLGHSTSPFHRKSALATPAALALSHSSPRTARAPPSPM